MTNVQYDWIYLPSWRPHFIDQTLEFLGIDKSKIINATPNTNLKAEKLIVPSFATHSCHTPYWIAEKLNEKLLPIKEKATKETTSLPKKFFISRSKAEHRRITNEADICTELGKRGFQTVYLEELAVLEQIALFNNAEFIVAAHGAGLTNLLFAKPGTKVIEIFQAHEDSTFFDLAQILKLDYQFIQTTPFVKNGGYMDTAVSWELVKEKVDLALTNIINP